MAAAVGGAGGGVALPDDYATLYDSRGDDLAGRYDSLFARYLASVTRIVSVDQLIVLSRARFCVA